MKKIEVEKLTAHKLEARWGKKLLAAGFTAIPDVIFQYQKALKLKHLDVLVLLYLASCWRAADQKPWPSKAKIADALDVDPRTIQRSIQRMEELGYVKRVYRRASAGDNMSNMYDLSGLVTAATKIANDVVETRKKRAEEDKSKQVTPTTFALINGGKA